MSYQSTRWTAWSDLFQFLVTEGNSSLPVSLIMLNKRFLLLVFHWNSVTNWKHCVVFQVDVAAGVRGFISSQHSYHQNIDSQNWFTTIQMKKYSVKLIFYALHYQKNARRVCKKHRKHSFHWSGWVFNGVCCQADFLIDLELLWLNMNHGLHIKTWFLF